MSTYFRPSIPLPIQIIKEKCEDGTLENIKIVKTIDQEKEVLHDGKNFIHFDLCKDNIYIIDLFRYGTNDETEIFEKIGNEFDINFVSEYEDEYHDLAVKDTNVVQIKIEREKNA